MKALMKEEGTIVLEGKQISFLMTRSHRRKRTIAFKMGGDSRLNILVPYRASFISISRILQKKASWIVQELADRQKSDPENKFTDQQLFSYLGHTYKLHITRGEHAPASCTLRPHILHVHVPNGSLSSQDLKEEVRLEILLWLKSRARLKLKKRLDIWAQKLNLSYKRLLITGPKHRWGSCSVDNTIRLNWRLMMAPIKVVDYVVAHELSHVRHKNHSKKFWHYLEKFMPDYLERRQHLRRLERDFMI